jgi:hypothetical protein
MLSYVLAGDDRASATGHGHSERRVCGNVERGDSTGGVQRLRDEGSGGPRGDHCGRFSLYEPLDNRLDQETYFRRCWPTSEVIERFDFVYLVTDGDRVFVTYEGRNTNGTRFRNTEILTIRDQHIVEVEVYFGWSGYRK